ncbi:MAG: hypothetical protein WD990_13585 [Acidimicrobiia bacterium]
MNRTRHGVALVIVAALAVFTILAIRPPEQVVVAMASTTTTAPATTSTTPPPRTTSTTQVDRWSEIEGIVADFYFAWFDGIHRQDPETLDRAAGSDAVLEQGIAAFETLQFTATPTRDTLGVELKNVLLDRPDCLVISADVDFRAFVDIDEVMEAVDVFFRVGDGWGRAVSYKYEQELWQVACDHMQRR